MLKRQRNVSNSYCNKNYIRKKQKQLGGAIMGAGGVPNRTIVRVDGRNGALPIREAKPNSRYDLYRDGEKIQSRWFDSEGNVTRNRDYKHQNTLHNHFFPHDHDWEWKNGKPKRDRTSLEPDYDRFK